MAIFSRQKYNQIIDHDLLLHNNFFQNTSLLQHVEKRKEKKQLTEITSTKNQIAVVFRDSITMIWLEKQIVLLLGPKGVIKPRKIISEEQNYLLFQNYLSSSLSYVVNYIKVILCISLGGCISFFFPRKLILQTFLCKYVHKGLLQNAEC